MADFDHESNPENDWEDGWETVLNEFDWERYLQKEQEEIAKYQKLYGKLIKSQNRLDEVALYMGWETGSNASETPDHIDNALDAVPEQPYTLHKHPLFIASKALHGWLTEKWTQHVSLCSDQISAPLTLRLQSALSQSDYYGLLAVTALDLGDYALAIAYFKRGLAAVNQSLSILNEIDELQIDPLPFYSKQARTRLFDLREIWLRVVSDCRHAMSRRPEEE
ncbi:MAG: hypothetical protein AAGB46_10110 [Verrucomicrobiota bacterium]